MDDNSKYASVVRMTFGEEQQRLAVREFLQRRGWEVESMYSDGDNLVVHAAAPSQDVVDAINGMVR